MNSGTWRQHRYGRISGGELERLIGVFDELWKERQSFAAIKDDPEQWGRAVGKLSVLPNWITLYEIPLLQLVATLVFRTGFGDQLMAAAKDGVDGLFQMLEELPETPPSNEDVLPAAMAMIGNLEAIALYSRSINDMVIAAKQGELSALGDAVSIDAYVICFRIFLAGMRIDQLAGDRGFTREVMRSLDGPHKGRYEYVKLRWAEYLLRDQGAFEESTREEIYSLIVERLKLYDVAGQQKDPKAALFATFRKWQKQAGIQNPHFGFSGKAKS